MSPTRSPATRRAHACLTWLSLSFVLLSFGCRGGPPAPGARGTTIQSGDLFATRSEVTVDDTVPGDVMLAANVIVFRGRADGDYLATADRQFVAGRIGGSARAAGRSVRLAADVGRNATLAGGHVQLDQQTTIGKNAYLAGQEVRVSGVVRGTLHVRGSRVLLDGTVGGNVDVDADRLRVGPNARIGGNLRYRVPRAQAGIDPGAQIRGRRIALQPRRGPDLFLVARVLLGTLGFLTAGIVAVLLFPRFAGAAAEAVARRPVATAGLGLLFLVAVPIAAGTVAITIIGIPLALIVIALYLISIYLARVAPAVWLGRRLLRGRGGAGRAGSVLGFLVGGAILLVAGLVPVVGGIVTVLATLAGLGALVVAIRAGRRRGTVAQAG